jgi:CheY-like chemotaxis protein
MDVQMPEMSGFEATEMIRRSERGTGHHIPIIAMTAHAANGYNDLCLQAGMDDYITKPVSLQILHEAIDHVLLARSER